MTTGKKILVTGINGFVGPHLARELHDRGCNVIGLGYGEAAPTLKNVVAEYHACDLTDETAVAGLDLANMDAVVHLAGLSSQGMSFAQPAKFIADNGAMLINLFEQALKQKANKLPRFIVISSGAIYNPNQPMPISEDGEISSTSPYAISKILCEHMCDYYRTRGFEAIVVRPFNHTGPGQGPGFLIPDLTAAVMNAGDGGTIKVGNLKSRRDYSDARDIVRGYADLALAENISGNVFNLCSGQSTSGEEILNIITKACLGDHAVLHAKVDQSKIRPNDPPDIFGDNTRAKQSLDYRPQYSLEQTIQDYVTWFKTQQK